MFHFATKVIFAPKSFSRRLKTELSLTPLLAAFLAACGKNGASGFSEGPFEADGIDVLVADGPLIGAQVYFDENGNGRVDPGEELVGITDAKGFILDIDPRFIGAALVSELGGSYDSMTGEIFPDGMMFRNIPGASEEGVIVLSPTTTAFLILSERNDQLPAAERLTDAQLLQRIFGSDTDVVMADIFDPTNYTWDGEFGEKGSAKDRQEEITKASIGIRTLAEEDYGNNVREAVRGTIDDQADGSGSLQEDDFSQSTKDKRDDRVKLAAATAAGAPIAIGSAATSDAVADARDEGTIIAGDTIYHASATSTLDGQVTWSLADDLDGLLSIGAHGEVSFTRDYELDFEGLAGQDFGFSLVATDSAGSKAFAIRLPVNDVNEAPSIDPVESNTASFAVGDVWNTALFDLDFTDPEGDAASWTLTGADAASFKISDQGVIQWIDAPSEADLGGLEQLSYQFSAVATDDGGLSSPELALSVELTPEFV